MKFVYHLLFYLRYGVTEAGRRKLHFTLAFISCLVVVTVAAVIQTVLEHAPLIFLRTAEGEAGEIDLRFEPRFEDTLLNYTRFKSAIETSNRMSPRVDFNEAFLDCQQCTSEEKDVDLVFMDSEREKDIEIGRQWSFGKIQKGKCLMHQKLAATLGVGVGDQITVFPNDYEWFFNVYYTYGNYSDDYQAQGTAYFNIGFNLVIQDLFASLEGKLPDSGSTQKILAEMDSLLPLYKSAIEGSFLWRGLSDYSGFMQFLENSDSGEFSKEVLITMPEPRSDPYMNSNYDSVQKEVTNYAAKIVDQLGFYPVDADLPVLQSLNNYRFVGVFLGILLNMILFILFMLSVILIYSLLMVSVETKTFELGVIRVLGLKKLGLVLLIFSQSLLFIIPAIVFGILLSFGANYLISGMFEESIGVGFDIAPTGGAILLAVSLGFLMPIVAGLEPLLTVFYSDLSEALDVSHSKSKAVAIHIDTSDKTVKMSLIVFGVITVGFGISVYILLPLALLSFNIQLFLGIFLATLIGFLIGLVLLTLNIQYLLEQLTVLLFLFFEKTALRKLTLKNLAAHRLRNRKTAVMYALALGFIIFLSVSYQMQLTTSTYQSLASRGVKLEVRLGQFEETTLPVSSLESIMDDYSDIIDSYSWVSQQLYTSVNGAERVLIKNLGKAYEFESKVVGVSPNLMETILEDFNFIGEEETTGLSLTEQLYTAKGTQGGLMGSVFKNKLDLELSKDSTFLLQIYEENNNYYREMRPIAFLDSLSGFDFSKYPQSLNQDFIVSLPTFVDLIPGASSIGDIPMARLLIKLNTEDDTKIDNLYAALDQTVEGLDKNWQVGVWDYRETKESADESAALMGTVFSVVTFIAMFLCFFSLVSSMTANMLEQSKEIAILRATGMSKLRVSMLYVYEGFVLIFSAGLMGLLIGTSVAWTMMAQQIIFTDLPMPFIFPWQVTIAVFVGSVLCAFLSSFFPARNLVKTQIANLMRKVD